MEQDFAVLSFDFDTKLEITINNSKPVELAGLTLSLLNVSFLYEKFIEGESATEMGASSELYIREVRSGSIVVELMTQSLPLVPLLWEGGGLTQWVDYIKSTADWLTGKLSAPPRDQSKKELNALHSIVDPVARDNAAQMNIMVSDRGTVINQFILDSEQANALQNSIRREIEKRDEPDSKVQKNKVMTWYQTKFERGTTTGDRAIIESISKRPVKVLFDNDAVKRKMLIRDERFGRGWHELAYVVDVRVETIAGVPKAYTVVRFHPDETFDPQE